MPNEIVLCDRYLFDDAIQELSLGFSASEGTGRFESTSQKRSELVAPARFIRLAEVLDIAGGDVRLFKTDTDGLDIPIVEQFLATRSAEKAVIFMELNPSAEITDATRVSSFLHRVEELSYSVAVFTNRGVPLVFQNALVADQVEDLLRHPALAATTSDVTPFHYLDVFLFPAQRLPAFREIAEGYRSRRFY
jgi:hypothetical protein